MKREKLKIGDYEIETIEWPRSWITGLAEAIEDGKVKGTVEYTAQGPLCLVDPQETENMARLLFKLRNYPRPDDTSILENPG